MVKCRIWEENRDNESDDGEMEDGVTSDHESDWDGHEEEKNYEGNGVERTEMLKDLDEKVPVETRVRLDVREVQTEFFFLIRGRRTELT